MIPPIPVDPSSDDVSAQGAPATCELAPCTHWTRQLDGPGSADESVRVVLAASDRAISVGWRIGNASEDLLVSAHATADGAELWSRTIDTGVSERAFQAVLSPDGSIAYVAAARDPGTGDWDWTVLALSVLTGATLWRTDLGGVGNEFPGGIAAIPDGTGIFVTGSLSVAGWQRPALVHVDAAGVATVLATYPELVGGSADSPPATPVAALPSGGAVVATQRTMPFPLAPNVEVRAHASNGALTWNTTLDAGGSDSPASVAVGDGRVHVAINAYRLSDMNATLAALDLGSGALLWSQTYDGPAPPQAFRRDDRLHAMALSNSGDLVVAVGESDGNGTSTDLVTIARWASNGTLAWVARDHVGSDAAYTVAIGASHVYVAGHANIRGRAVAYDRASGVRAWAWTDSVSGFARGVALAPDGSALHVALDVIHDFADVGVRALDPASGALLWNATVSAPGSGVEALIATGLSPDGSTLFGVATADSGSPLPDVLVVALDASSGETRWSARHDTGGSDQAVDLVVSPDGARVYVAASTWGPTTGLDWLTLAFDAASGALLWSARHDGARHVDDQIRAVSITPDGSRILVAGWTYPSTGGARGTVIAYSPAGALQWSVTSGLGADLREIAVSADGTKAFVVGRAEGVGPTGYGVLAAAVHLADGSLAWAQTRNATTVTYVPSLSAIALSPEGTRVFVSGHLNAKGFVAAHDTLSGSEAWSHAGSQFLVALAVAPSGDHVLAAGTESNGSATWGNVTRLQAGTGTPDWSLRTPTTMGQVAWLATSPDGKQLVAAFPPANFGATQVKLLGVRSEQGALAWEMQVAGNAQWPRGGGLHWAQGGEVVFGHSIEARTRSDLVFHRVQAVAMPGAPSLAVARGPGAGQLSLSWTPSGEPAQEFQIFRAEGAAPLTPLARVAGTSFVDGGLASNTTYRYAVQALGLAGAGPLSNEASDRTFAPPGVPLDLASSTGPASGSLRVTWRAPASELPLTSVKIYRGPTQGSQTLHATLDPAATSFTDAGLAPGSTWWYRVSAASDAGEGASAGPVQARAGGPPTAPRDLTAAPTDGSPRRVELTWRAPLDSGGAPIVAYRIYRGTESGSETFLREVGPTTGTNDTVPLTSTDLVWYYRVSARTSVGIGDLSNEACSAAGPWPRGVTSPDMCGLVED